jgi:hypothetical protein
MKDPLACLTGVVGVADTDCDCFETGRPDDYDEATSGLYISQLVDLDTLSQAYQCSSSTIWTIGAKVIQEATNLFQGNLLQCFAGKHKAREKWQGLVGKKDCPQPVTPGTTYAGLTIKPDPNIPDGEMVITNIGTVFSQTGEVIVRIYEKDNNTMLHEITLDTVANGYIGNPLMTPIVLPFTGADRAYRTYQILYEVSSNRPKEGEVNCGCSSNSARMQEWVSMFGTRGNVLSERPDWNQEAIHFGILPTITFRCKVDGSICDDEIDFQTNANAMVMAEAIWFLAASKIPDAVRRSMKVLPSNLITDQLKEDAAKHQAEYSARVSALCNTMTPNSCFKCKPKMGMIGARF